MTLGDPAGIGPDLIVSAWCQRAALDLPLFLCVGNCDLLRARASLLGLATTFCVAPISHPSEAAEIYPKALPVIELKTATREAVPGQPSAGFAGAIIESIETATTLAMSGLAAAIVTSPIAKDILLQSGFRHAGHTEFLAELAGRHGYPGLHPVMLMASDRLRAVPVTVHIPLKDVPAALNASLIVTTAKTTAAGLSRYFGIDHPRLAVCGLNPHAGENGELGREEIEVIGPALRELISGGVDVSGPFPADTIFHEAARRNYDAVLAMYHDQALIPFKTLSFEDGVNVTLGLPFMRTSPDHGTAFSLAGTGRANLSSFVQAMHLAQRMHRAATRQ